MSDARVSRIRDVAMCVNNVTVGILSQKKKVPKGRTSCGAPRKASSANHQEKGGVSAHSGAD